MNSISFAAGHITGDLARTWEKTLVKKKLLSMLLQEELGKLSHSGINEIGKNISGKLAERKKL